MRRDTHKIGSGGKKPHAENPVMVRSVFYKRICMLAVKKRRLYTHAPVPECWDCGVHCLPLAYLNFLQLMCTVQ